MAKNFWLQLETGFFDRTEIRCLETYSNGNEIVILYLKLMAKAIPGDGYLSLGYEVAINETLISSITNIPVETVMECLPILLQMKLVSLIDNYTIFIADTKDRVGSAKRSSNNSRYNRKNDFSSQIHKTIENESSTIEKPVKLTKKERVEYIMNIKE